VSARYPASIRELVDRETPRERAVLLADRYRNAAWLSDIWRSADPKRWKERIALADAKRLLFADWAGLSADRIREEWEVPL